MEIDITESDINKKIDITESDKTESDIMESCIMEIDIAHLKKNKYEIHPTSYFKISCYSKFIIKVPFQVPFSVAEIVIHMQGLHQTASLRQNKELASMSTTSQSPQWY